MGSVSKEGYERKREWAARRMAENAEIESLTEEQHEYLAKLCNFRHELHTSWRSAFNPYSAEFSRFSREISEYSDNQDLIYEGMKLFGKAPFAATDYPTFDSYEEDGYEDYDEAFDAACEEFRKINSDIESFLLEIDKEHGTDYCPSGATRL